MFCFKSFSSPLSVISLRTNQQPSQPPSLSPLQAFSSCFSWLWLSKSPPSYVVQFGWSWIVHSVQELVGNLSKNPVISVKSDFSLVTIYRRGSYNILLGRIFFFLVYTLGTWTIVIGVLLMFSSGYSRTRRIWSHAWTVHEDRGGFSACFLSHW